VKWQCLYLFFLQFITKSISGKIFKLDCFCRSYSKNESGFLWDGGTHCICAFAVKTGELTILYATSGFIVLTDESHYVKQHIIASCLFLHTQHISILAT